MRLQLALFVRFPSSSPLMEKPGYPDSLQHPRAVSRREQTRCRQAGNDTTLAASNREITGRPQPRTICSQTPNAGPKASSLSPTDLSPTDNKQLENRCCPCGAHRVTCWLALCVKTKARIYDDDQFCRQWQPASQRLVALQL